MSFYLPDTRLWLGRLATGAVLAAFAFIALIIAGVLPGSPH